MPYHVCQIESCRTHVSEAKLYRFPGNAEKGQQWVNIIKCKKLAKVPIRLVKYKMICGKHFTRSCFTSSERTKLKPDALPSLELSNDEFDPLDIRRDDLVTSSSCSDNKNNNVISIINSPVADVITVDDPSTFEPEPEPELEPPIIEKPVDSRCRICLVETDSAIPLNHSTNISGEGGRTLCEILNKCSKVEIAVDDNKPQSLCIDCVEKARVAYEFCIRCESSESILQKEVENAKEQNSVTPSCVTDETELIKKSETCKISQKPAILTIKNTSSEPSKTVVVSSTTKTSTVNAKCKELVNSRLRKVGTTYDKRKSTTSNVMRTSKNNKKKSAVKKVKRTLCVQCCRNFSSRAKFKLYTNVLIKRKSYHCACGARFASGRNLKLHIVFHKEILSYKRPKRMMQQVKS